MAKLHYNLEEALQKMCHLADIWWCYSNHIAATALPESNLDFKPLVLLEAEATQPLNPTLQYAVECGMQLRYVSREDYRDKTSKVFAEKYLLGATLLYNS